MEDKEFLETFWDMYQKQNCMDFFELRCMIGRMIGVLQGNKDFFTDEQKDRIETSFIKTLKLNNELPKN
mgnify:FL=1